MNREILFIGKRIDNNEWVYGYYFVDLENKKTYIMLSERKQTPEDWMIKSVEVIPETVCQFTGLTDKNGNNIFEGDIIKLDDIKCPIVFNDGSFDMITNNNQGKSVATQDRTKRFVIIGNIYDNPELLK